MTMELIIDLADGTGAKYARHGWEIDRPAIVQNVEGDGYKKVVNALACPGLPFIGWPHPYLPNTYLEEITVAAVTGSTVHLRLHYANPSKRANAESPTIEYGSSMTQLSVNTDKEGTKLSVTYGGVSQRGIVSIAATEKHLVYHRIETSDPEAKWFEYDGAVNSITWRGKAARTWFCVIRASSSNNGVTWEVTYEFYYRDSYRSDVVETWDARVAYNDPATGRPPDDVVEGTGVKNFRCIKEKDFNLLLLNL